MESVCLLHQFTGVCLTVAYAQSLGGYLTGEFNAVYSFLDLVFITIGLVCLWLLVIRHSPKLAYR